MTFDELLTQVTDLLQRQGRLSYRALKARLQLDDNLIEALKDELIYAQRMATDKDGRVLVWISAPSTPLVSAPAPASTQEREPLSYTPPHLAAKIRTTRSALEGERKQVTVLFCDLANSTTLAERLGPEAMHTLLNRLFALALDDVHRYEGTINQFLGDGFMALFGAPIAQEDHARRAVLAALALQRSLQEHHATLGEPHGVTCTLRMGLNTGLVVVGSIGDNLRMDYTAVGDTTNLAARLQQVAEPGTILLSDATRRLVRGHVRLETLPAVLVKGKSAPTAIYRVVDLGPRRAPLAEYGERVLSQFVGRARELAVLEELLARAEEGQGQVVGIVGEAGFGKSRLLYEFQQRLAARRVTYLEGGCLSYGHTMPYHPISEILRRNCGLLESDAPEVIVTKGHAALQEVGLEPEATAPYLLQLLGVQEGTAALAQLSPEAIKTRTFATLKQMSLRGSQQRPLIFAVEDVHWSDKTSEEFFTSLVENIAGATIMLLVTYRPGYRPPWLDKSYATQITLRSLVPDDGAVIVHSTQPRAQLPEALVQLILAKAEGNPFFLEELTRAVREQGAFQADVPVPDTIQGVIMARIDCLPESSKRLLQTAVVLGREFAPRLLAALWDDAIALEALLADLKRLEFLYERTDVAGSVYVFKHSLTQEVAYASLLTPRRQALHAAAGQALERLYADRLEEAYDRLAYHYSKTDHADKAVIYLTRFAERAASGYAHTEAAAALQEALLHAERLPAETRDGQLLRLVLRRVHSLYFLGRFPDSLDLLLQQQQRLQQVQDAALAGEYYFWLGHTYTYLGEQEKAAACARQAIDMAQASGDMAALGKAWYVLARTDLWTSQIAQSIEHCQQAIAALEGTPDVWWLGQSTWWLGGTYHLTGAWELALETYARADSIGDRIGDPRLQTYVAWARGWMHGMIGNWEAGIAACQRSLDLSPDPLNTTFALGFLGYVYVEKGDATAAIAVLEPAVQRMQQFHMRQVECWFTTFLGEAYFLHGESDKARDLVHRGLVLAQEAGFLPAVGWAQRALGRIALARQSFPEAEGHLHAALQTFTTSQMRLEVARTHLDLAALAHAAGNQEATAGHLHQAYELFTALRVARYIERTTHLARTMGVHLGERSEQI